MDEILCCVPVASQLLDWAHSGSMLAQTVKMSAFQGAFALVLMWTAWRVSRGTPFPGHTYALLFVFGFFLLKESLDLLHFGADVALDSAVGFLVPVSLALMVYRRGANRWEPLELHPSWLEEAGDYEPAGPWDEMP
jgi:hypothetical protein